MASMALGRPPGLAVLHFLFGVVQRRQNYVTLCDFGREIDPLVCISVFVLASCDAGVHASHENVVSSFLNDPTVLGLFSLLLRCAACLWTTFFGIFFVYNCLCWSASSSLRSPTDFECLLLAIWSRSASKRYPKNVFSCCGNPLFRDIAFPWFSSVPGLPKNSFCGYYWVILAFKSCPQTVCFLLRTSTFSQYSISLGALCDMVAWNAHHGNHHDNTEQHDVVSNPRLCK